MIKPSMPADEALRLATLRALNILDTPPEERFDRVTRLACRLFDVPIAIVSLVDAERQWFKSRQGVEATETPREISFCGHAITQDEPLVVMDAQHDLRFADNPLVTGDPHVRFYAGYPLRAANGTRLGVLCAIDTQPREMGHEDLAVLRDLAQLVENELHAIEMATVDELTGISNRRGFMMMANHALEYCKREGRIASLMYFDLDRFKSINDNWGHAAGDEALVEMSVLLMDTFRGSDVIGRIGGDEFCVLATGAAESDLTYPLRRLEERAFFRDRVSRKPYRLTFSVGRVRYDRHRHGSVESLLEEADKSMYRRKQIRDDSVATPFRKNSLIA